MEWPVQYNFSDAKSFCCFFLTWEDEEGGGVAGVVSGCGFQLSVLLFEAWNFQINLQEKGLSKNPNPGVLIPWRSG